MPTPKSAVVDARTLFIYGPGDGKRIVSVQALVARTGLHPNTITKHIKSWQKEYEEIVAGTSETAFALSLSAKDIQEHSADMIFIRSQINAVKWEMDNLDNIISKLETIVDNISQQDSDSGEKALRYFDKYIRASINKASLRSQFLALQKQWTTLAGIMDLKDIETTRAKEMSKGRAKIDLKKLEAENNSRNVTPDGSGIFSRPAISAESEDVESE